jgi:ABC-type phosphate/phosphonate transport system substrate-binding protein
MSRSRSLWFGAVPLLVATLLHAAPAHAGPHNFVVYIARLGGDTGTARPYVQKFAAHLEKVMGWKKGSCSGAFFADRKEALAYIEKSQPGFALLDPPLYFELRESEQLTLVGQLKSPELVSPRLQVVVKDKALSSLEALKGKKLTTTLAASPRYLSKVIFDGKLDAGKHFELKRVGTALKGVRAVLTGQAQATLLDDDQLAAARKMEGGQALRAIFSSPPLPPLPVAVFGKNMKPAEARALEKALPKLCTGEGAQICKDMRLPGFQPKNSALFTPTQQRFERP